MLSIDANTLPEDVKASGKRTFRTLSIDGEEFEFSEGFTGLHTKSYEEIIKGNGFGIGETRAAIQLVHDIRKYK
jgi:UDP-N-acetyl-2-amino-2-deoxyglucuronate dehydrogenase